MSVFFSVLSVSPKTCQVTTKPLADASHLYGWQLTILLILDFSEGGLYLLYIPYLELLNLEWHLVAHLQAQQREVTDKLQRCTKKDAQTLKSFLLRCKTGLWRKRICLVDKLPSLQKRKVQHYNTARCFAVNRWARIFATCIKIHFLLAAVCMKWQTTRREHFCSCFCTRRRRLSEAVSCRGEGMIVILSDLQPSVTGVSTTLSKLIPKENETGRVPNRRIKRLWNVQRQNEPLVVGGEAVINLRRRSTRQFYQRFQAGFL